MLALAHDCQQATEGHTKRPRAVIVSSNPIGTSLTSSTMPFPANGRRGDQLERRFEILAACVFGESAIAPLANAAAGIVTEVSASRAISYAANPSASRTKRSARAESA